MSTISFYALIALTGSKEGARTLFERMIAQLVRLKYPTVRRVEANPGDWGIDVVVGQLDELICVWQSKFFIDEIGDTQKNEIRESFNSLMENARKRAFTVDSWTLCIPCSMDGPTTQWWDGWKRRSEKEYPVKIGLWDETELEGLLLSPEASSIRDCYFGQLAGRSSRFPLPVQQVPEEVSFEDMLFIKQLLAAQIAELDGAKQQFFNHDLLAREIADKGVMEEIDALRTCGAELHSLWETRFNQYFQTQHPSDVQLPGLHREVMTAIENLHNARHPSPVPMSLVHRLGSMHQVVEDGRAGWVRNFRAIARDHGRKC